MPAALSTLIHPLLYSTPLRLSGIDKCDAVCTEACRVQLHRSAPDQRWHCARRATVQQPASIIHCPANHPPPPAASTTTMPSVTLGLHSRYIGPAERDPRPRPPRIGLPPNLPATGRTDPSARGLCRSVRDARPGRGVLGTARQVRAGEHCSTAWSTGLLDVSCHTNGHTA